MNPVIRSIREIINQKGMKQCAVAKRAGFTPQEFSNILCEKKVFKTEYIMPICNVSCGMFAGRWLYASFTKQYI